MVWLIIYLVWFCKSLYELRITNYEFLFLQSIEVEKSICHLPFAEFTKTLLSSLFTLLSSLIRSYHFLRYWSGYSSTVTTVFYDNRNGNVRVVVGGIAGKPGVVFTSVLSGSGFTGYL